MRRVWIPNHDLRILLCYYFVRARITSTPGAIIWPVPERWWRAGRHQLEGELLGVLREHLTMYKRRECSEVFTKPESTAHRNHLGFLGRVRKGVCMALGTLPGRWPGRWPERTENFDHSSSADSLGQTAELKPSLESGFFFFF